jgi:hypothetical protein
LDQVGDRRRGCGGQPGVDRHRHGVGPGWEGNESWLAFWPSRSARPIEEEGWRGSGSEFVQ